LEALKANIACQLKEEKLQYDKLEERFERLVLGMDQKINYLLLVLKNRLTLKERSESEEKSKSGFFQ